MKTSTVEETNVDSAECRKVWEDSNLGETWKFQKGKWTVTVHKIVGEKHIRWRANINKKLRGKNSAGFVIDSDNPAELISTLIDRLKYWI